MPHEDPPTGLAVPIRLPAGLARVRRRWDRAARADALPHVTVLYPFVPAAQLSAADRAALALIASTIRPFAVRFRRVRRFDEGVVWIEPVPADPFQALTRAVAERWPAYPPYGGRFDEVIPHLTVVEADDGPDAPSLEAVEIEVAGYLPFHARADRLELWRQDAGGRWHPHWRLKLGEAVRP